MFKRLSITSIFILAGCATDPGAITSFSSLAPNADKLHVLTAAYVEAPNQLSQLDLLHLIDEAKFDPKSQAEARNKEIVEIDALHATIINYMASLSLLADNELVQTSDDAKSVTEGLTAIETSKPSIGLNGDMISGAGKILTLLEDAATTGYRQEQLTSVIQRAEGPFQQLVSAEKKIVIAMKSELQNVWDRTVALKEVSHALRVNATEEEARATRPRSGANGVSGLNPKLQDGGAADLASLYLLEKSISVDLISLDTKIKAANDYADALDKIAAAHTVLYQNSQNILTREGAKTAIKELKPLVKDAHAALQSLKSM